MSDSRRFTAASTGYLREDGGRDLNMPKVPGEVDPDASTVATRRFEASARWRRIKTCTNYSILTIAAVQVILAIVQVARNKNWWIYWAFIGPVTGASILWTLAELFVQYRGRKKPVKKYRGIHPGVHVGMHFALAATQMTSCGGITIPSRLCDPYWTSPCISPELEFAVGSFSAVLCALHTLFFIRACVETHRYRASTSTTTVPADVSGGDDLPVVVQSNPNASSMPAELSIPGNQGHSGLYVVTGPDGDLEQAYCRHTGGWLAQPARWAETNE